ncbi:hypothetical protein [Kordia sp.]|uniref:hypothetical protein n=1 Tax=Kordia sp. TaxID=1965332 RepID=UPI003D2D2927
MKYFGFIKEHENQRYAKSISELISSNTQENAHRKDVINYLKKGKLCVPLMGFVEDANDPYYDTDDYNDDDFIGYLSIYTDGKWFWPQYIIAYIEKYPTINIDTKFLNHVLTNISKDIKLSEEEILKLENTFIKKAGFKKIK